MPDHNLDDLNRQLSAKIHKENNTPLRDFLDISPVQMGALLQDLFSEASVVQFRDDLTSEDAASVLILRQVRYLLEQLTRAEIKLTQTGNLPRKHVRAMHEMRNGELTHDLDTTDDIRSENDYNGATAAKQTAVFAGWISKQKQRLRITKKGRAFLQNEAREQLVTLFNQLIQTYPLDHSPYIVPRYEAIPEGLMQHFTGFILLDFLRNGKEWRKESVYVNNWKRAFPHAVSEFPNDGQAKADELIRYAYNQTFLDRGLLGLCGFLRTRRHDFASPAEVMATDLFRRCFHVVPDARPPEQEEATDAQINAALFDAEMGSSTWVNPDMPPELQQIFQDRVRAFESGEGRVRIGDLMKGVKLRPVESITDHEAAVTAVIELVEALSERYIVFHPPTHVPPEMIYRFMVEDLFAHEIAKPTLNLPAFVPWESVATDNPFPTGSVFAAETFLLILFNLDHPLPEDIFAEQMRLGGRMVSRREGMAHAQRWRDQWQRIVPLDFTPGPTQEAGDATYQFVRLSFEATDTGGKTEEHEWTGVVQLIEGQDGEFVVQGAMFEGFEF